MKGILHYQIILKNIQHFRSSIMSVFLGRIHMYPKVYFLVHDSDECI